MNRLSPLITRSSARSAAMARTWDPAPIEATAPSSELMADLRLFLVGWLGGLVFFGTLLA